APRTSPKFSDDDHRNSMFTMITPERRAAWDPRVYGTRVSGKAEKGIPMRKTIAKAVTWRVIGTAEIFAISFWTTGHIATAGHMAGIAAISSILMYVVHELAWSRHKAVVAAASAAISIFKNEFFLRILPSAANVKRSQPLASMFTHGNTSTGRCEIVPGSHNFAVCNKHRWFCETVAWIASRPALVTARPPRLPIPQRDRFTASNNATSMQ
ncbi:MAG: DUF2061 domain-containing protein, partial [Bradyrhizobium sp.]